MRHHEDPGIALWALRFAAGEISAARLAVCNPHGRWIEWGATRET
jgi:hypothetical protein